MVRARKTINEKLPIFQKHNENENPDGSDIKVTNEVAERIEDDNPRGKWTRKKIRARMRKLTDDHALTIWPKTLASD